ncbi:MAG: DegT/DnrJ/EryC1/StrS family aminotransferase [Trueperaceae bacterium]|nr:MAG: DegT/DnrJ/EryC1/StrS family aminotransferase [Trueperaceae bacterium]
MITVPMYDHAAHYKQYRNDLDEARHRVLERGLLDWGPEVPAFESEFAEWLGSAHAVTTNSGTAALKVAMLSLGIGPGDEVITVPNSDISSTSAIHHVGAKAVWVDVEADTMNLDPALLEAAITPRTKAILPVHMYGHPADLPAISEIATNHGLYLIEDACLALGASIDGRAVGLWGHASCFSFAPSKHLGAFGNGGVVVTNDPEVAEKMRQFAGYGQPRERHYRTDPTGGFLEHRVEGLNERLDELQAAMLRAKLPHLHEFIWSRRNHAEVYRSSWGSLSFELPVERLGCVHSYRNYVLRAENRDRVRTALADAGIATGTPYVPPLHLQPVYQSLGYGPGSFPVTEAAAQELFSVPVSPELTSVQRDHLIEQVKALSD